MKEVMEVYRCDNCSAVLSEDGEGKKHLSLIFKQHSGWVDKTQENIANVNCHCKWQHLNPQIEGIKHFCDGRCLAHYFEVEIFSQARNGN